MAKTLQFRRGTTSELSSVTGSVGELFVNTEKDTVVVMDGSTSGGFELVNLNATQTLTNKTLTSPVISTISNTGTLTLPTSTDTLVGRATTDTLTNKTLDDATLTGTLTAGGGVGTSGQVLKSTGTGVEWGAAAADVDFSAVAEDILPSLDAVYDLGSSSKQFYDVFASNGITIDGQSITGSDDGLIIDSSLLVGDLLIQNDTITPDDGTIRQYAGSKGWAKVDGNLEILGDMLNLPIADQYLDEDSTLTDPKITDEGEEGSLRYNNIAKSVELYNDKNWQLAARPLRKYYTATDVGNIYKSKDGWLNYQTEKEAHLTAGQALYLKYGSSYLIDVAGNEDDSSPTRIYLSFPLGTAANGYKDLVNGEYIDVTFHTSKGTGSTSRTNADVRMYFGETGIEYNWTNLSVSNIYAYRIYGSVQDQSDTQVKLTMAVHRLSDDIDRTSITVNKSDYES